jgi:hypothetical protein
MLMSAPLVGEVGGALAPGSEARSLLGPVGLSVARSCQGCAVDVVTDGDHEAISCGVMTAGARGVRVAEPVVRGVEEMLEHHWVRHTREVPLHVPTRGGGRQLASGAVVGLVVGGGNEVPDRQKVVAGKVLVRRPSVLADEAYSVAALRIPWGNRGSGIARSPVGAAAVSLAGASRCEATRAARRRSIAPYESVGRSAVGVKLPRSPQRPPGWAPGCQHQAWRELVLARSTATGGAQHG